MDRIIDLTKTRKARHERGENFRTASRDLLMMLEKQREFMSEEFMTFLTAMAVSDQALHYAAAKGSKKAGMQFIDHVFTTVKQIYETNYPAYPENRPRAFQKGMDGQGRVMDFCRDEACEQPRAASDNGLD